MENPEFVSRNIHQELDLTQVILGLAQIDSRQNEISQIFSLFAALATQEVKILEAMSPVMQEVTRLIVPFYEQRMDVYRRTLRLKKLFSFRHWGEIDSEASERAWEDTMRMLSRISVSESPLIRGMIESRQSVLETIAKEMQRLLQQSDNHWAKEIDLDHIRSLVSGRRPPEEGGAP